MREVERIELEALRVDVQRLRAENERLREAMDRHTEPGDWTPYSELAVERGIQDRRIAELRGLIAECLALNPHISGDMEKVRVWAEVVAEMRKACQEVDDE